MTAVPRREDATYHESKGGQHVPHNPNFIYIGPDKAGSSWLHEVLIRHESIFMPPAKDLYFFDRYYNHGLPWYLDHFDGAGPQHTVIGEVCQDYLFHPEAPARIRESLDDVRFMVTLRDPAERAFSSYLYMLKQGETPGTFLEALETRPELLDHGRYATSLKRFEEMFGDDRVYVGVFDDLVEDQQLFIDRLLAWLQLAPMVLPDDLVDARLPAGRARSMWLSRAARRGSEFVREHNGANLIGHVKRSSFVQRTLYRQLGDDKPTMTATERSAVCSALEREIVALDQRYGLGLAERWGWSVAQHSGELPLDAGTT
jgi:Sulfotransferase family